MRLSFKNTLGELVQLGDQQAIDAMLGFATADSCVIVSRNGEITVEPVLLLNRKRTQTLIGIPIVK